MLSYSTMYEINMIMYIHNWKLTRILIGCIKFELFFSLQVLMNVICTPSRLILVVWVSRMLTASLRLNLLGLSRLHSKWWRQHKCCYLSYQTCSKYLYMLYKNTWSLCSSSLHMHPWTPVWLLQACVSVAHCLDISPHPKIKTLTSPFKPFPFSICPYMPSTIYAISIRSQFLDSIYESLNPKTLRISI